MGLVFFQKVYKGVALNLESLKSFSVRWSD